jgi:hypothetical protein
LIVAIIKPVIFFLLLCVAFLELRGQAKDLLKKIKDTAVPKVDSLKAAIVTASIRPRMKGDTLEYNTEHMQVPPNAVVEELLKRLPGLHVDPDGTITYNGEKIEHLLVDGQDIFGSDPTMVTRNFDATKIARVQLLDRKTDQAIFTGVDDGTRIKTLNLVMKESAKDGFFGKVEAGGDTKGYYSANGALAAFRDKEQFTALGLASNTGILGFAGGNGSAGSISFLNGNTDALGASAGTGVPRFDAAALHYYNNWNNRQDDLNANYQYSHYYSQPITSMQSVQTQVDSIYGQKQNSQSTNRQDQHWLYLIYNWAPDARSAFKFTFHGSNSQGENTLGSNGVSTFNDTLVNTNQRTIRDNVSRVNVGGEVAWRIRIGGRTDRVFSADVGATKIDNTTDGYLYSIDQFFTAGGLTQSADTTDQRKQIISHSMNVVGSINYTEPLWRGAVLGLSYRLSHTGDDPLQATFNRGEGKYQDQVDSLSSRLKTDLVNQYATVTIQGKTGPLNYIIGNDWIGYAYRQRDLMTDSVLHLQYGSLAPRVFLVYTPDKSTNVDFNYVASTLQPSVAQLTPVANNSDPLHIALGNPGLKPGFSQDFRLDFRHFTTWLVNVSLNGALVNNNISTRTTTDSLGRQISQSVNVDGGRTAGLNFSVNRKVLGFDAGVYGTGTYTRSVTFVNADLSRNDAYSGGGGVSLNRFVPDKYGLQLRTNFTYFDQLSSINTAAPVHYWTQNHQGSVTLYLIRGFEVNTNVNYTWQEKTSAFGSNTSLLLWNGYVGRNFLHNKLVARFQLNNLLNRNAGISRSNVGNVNTQSSTDILGRYWMISVAYHFDKQFKKK